MLLFFSITFFLFFTCFRELFLFDNLFSFELSSYPAVGIMIYGFPVFENVPMESLIKHFRDECDITKMDSLLM